MIESTLLKRYHIYGERSSGTNFLDHSIKDNFDAINVFDDVKDVDDIIERYRTYGHKHWFGDDLDLSNTDDVLFLCIVRDPIDWLRSIYRTPRNLYEPMVESQERFLFGKYASTAVFYDEKVSFKLGGHESCNNIFEVRHIKLEWICEKLPKLVKNYMLIRYEDLKNDFQGTMKKIKDMGLIKKNDISEDIVKMKKWMKRDGLNDPIATFDFAQKDPKVKLQPTYYRPNYKPFNFSIEDYPREFLHYEKVLGYLQ